MSAPAALIEAHDLDVNFGATRALEQVSLTLRPRETLGLVGESGSGKSTLARVLLGLQRPTRGSLKHEGWEQLRRRVQPVFQDASTALDPRWTIGESLAEPFDIHRLPKKDRLVPLLEQVALPADVLDKKPHQVSSGQRQRALIARALAVEPEFLILDEPVSALDVSVQAQILQLLLELKVRRNLGWLFITHDLAVVSQMSSQLMVMRAGRVLETGPTEKVLSAPQHEYTRALLASLPAQSLSQRKAR